MSLAVLMASSPVEISAKADEAGLGDPARAAASALFHDLTDRVGQAVVALEVPHEDWPLHRFYFAPEPAALDRLLGLLRARPDILDVSDGVPAAPGPVAGLFARAEAEGFAAVLVAHPDHEGHADA